MKLIVFEAQEQ